MDVDPGVPLAAAIRGQVRAFERQHRQLPRVIPMANHGLITPAASPAGCLAATLMASKAAGIFTAAAALGGPVFMSPDDVARIHGRKDEDYRRKQLNV